jgi:hypothetical protein
VRPGAGAGGAPLPQKRNILDRIKKRPKKQRPRVNQQFHHLAHTQSLLNKHPNQR